MAVRGVDYEIMQKWPRLEQSNITYPSGDNTGLPMDWIARTTANAAGAIASGYFNEMALEFSFGDRIDIHASDDPGTATTLKKTVVVNSNKGVTPVTVLSWPS